MNIPNYDFTITEFRNAFEGSYENYCDFVLTHKLTSSDTLALIELTYGKNFVETYIIGND